MIHPNPEPERHPLAQSEGSRPAQGIGTFQSATATRRVRPPSGGRNGGCAGRNTVTPSSPRDPNRRSPGNDGKETEGGLRGALRPHSLATAARPASAGTADEGPHREPASAGTPTPHLHSAFGHERARRRGNQDRSHRLASRLRTARLGLGQAKRRTSQRRPPAQAARGRRRRSLTPTNRRRTPSGASPG